MGCVLRYTIWHVIGFSWLCNMPQHFGMGDMTILRYAKKWQMGFCSCAGMYLGHYCAWIASGILCAAAHSHGNRNRSRPDCLSRRRVGRRDLRGGGRLERRQPDALSRGHGVAGGHAQLEPLARDAGGRRGHDHLRLHSGASSRIWTCCFRPTPCCCCRSARSSSLTSGCSRKSA